MTAAGDKGTGSAARGHRSGEDIDLARINGGRHYTSKAHRAHQAYVARAHLARRTFIARPAGATATAMSEVRKVERRPDGERRWIDAAGYRDLRTNQTSGKCRFSEYYEQGAFVEHVLRSESLRYAVRLVPWQLLQSREPPPLVQHFRARASQAEPAATYAEVQLAAAAQLCGLQGARGKAARRDQMHFLRENNSFRILRECGRGRWRALTVRAARPPGGKCGGNGCDLRPGADPNAARTS